MSEKTKHTVTDIIYKANRDYDKLGPRNKKSKVYVGWHSLIGKYIIAVEMEGLNVPIVYFMGQTHIEDREKLIDYAMHTVEIMHGELIVYPEFKR